jgi:alpha/beta superfamily hydrolase
VTATHPALTAERVALRSGEFTLEGVLTYPDDAQVTDLALLVNPHPCLGGAMDNNVVLALETELTQRGVAALRFNFRGVGESESDVPLEAQIAGFWETPRIARDGGTALVDLRAAADFARESVPSARHLWLLGYSFGAVIALLLAEERHDIAGLALVSPPVHQLERPWPAELAVPTVLVRGGDDLGVDETAFSELMFTFPVPPRVIVYPEADHFFLGLESRLARDIVESLLPDA